MKSQKILIAALLVRSDLIQEQIMGELHEVGGWVSQNVTGRLVVQWGALGPLGDWQVSIFRLLERWKQVGSALSVGLDWYEPTHLNQISISDRSRMSRSVQRAASLAGLVPEGSAEVFLSESVAGQWPGESAQIQVVGTAQLLGEAQGERVFRLVCPMVSQSISIEGDLSLIWRFEEDEQGVRIFKVSEKAS